MMWKEGTILHSIDDLEANVDNILAELTQRATRQWSIERIQYNFVTSQTMLPDKLMNLFNLTPSDLNLRIHSNTIGANRNKNYDEIWFVIDNSKYIMTREGVIKIASLNVA